MQSIRERIWARKRRENQMTVKEMESEGQKREWEREVHLPWVSFCRITVLHWGRERERECVWVISKELCIHTYVLPHCAAHTTSLYCPKLQGEGLVLTWPWVGYWWCHTAEGWCKNRGGGILRNGGCRGTNRARENGTEGTGQVILLFRELEERTDWEEGESVGAALLYSPSECM